MAAATSTPRITDGAGKENLLEPKEARMQILTLACGGANSKPFKQDREWPPEENTRSAPKSAVDTEGKKKDRLDRVFSCSFGARSKEKKRREEKEVARLGSAVHGHHVDIVAAAVDPPAGGR